MFIKPDSKFKISKTVKRELATIVDPHERGIQKRIMIQAQLQGAIKPKKEKKKGEPDLDLE